MPTHDVKVECRVPDSFEVKVVRGMFDLKSEKTSRQRFKVELPADDDTIDGEPWRIGVIVGPSGSGKSTVARHAYGERFVEGFEWDPTKAVVANFDGVDVKAVTQAMAAVGFSSPPAWVRPHHVLSGGERFRCDLARALLSGGPLVAFDEFTSVVDRTVARVGSAAIAKQVRKGTFDTPATAKEPAARKQFVAVTCHYDVLDWLEPDWVLDMSTQQLARGRLHQRPSIHLTLAPVHRSAWLLFRRHHYLNTEISVGARCFAAFWEDEPVAFSAWLHAMSSKRRKGDMREHRTVTLPDFQGVGIGNRVSDAAASVWRGLNRRASSVTSHPSMVHYRSRSPLWKRIRLGRVAAPGAKATIREGVSSSRITGGFKYVGPGMDSRIAERLAGYYPTEHLVAALRRLGPTTVGVLADAINYSTTSVTGELQDLVEAGRVRRWEHRRGRYAYELTD